MMTRIVLIAALATACTDTYHYDPSNAGKPEGVQVDLRAKSSTQFLRGIYADLLGRTPETYEVVIKLQGTEVLRFTINEEQLLISSLEGLGDSLPMRNLITLALLHSAEVTLPEKSTVEPREYISEQFRRMLGREPNVYELESFVAAWQTDPAVGPRTVIRAIVASREYQSQ